MRSCGLGLGTLMAPILALALIVSIGTFHLMANVEPVARQKMRVILKTLASQIGVVEPGSFQNIASRMIFARHRDEDNLLRGVVLWDTSDRERPFTVFAESGRVTFDVENAKLHLHLTSGDLHLDPQEGDDRYRRMSFATFDYSFDLGKILKESASKLRPRDMTMAELYAVRERVRQGDKLRDLKKRDPLDYELQIYRRYAVPVAPLVFAFVGVPLGLRSTRGARSWGAMLCMGLSFSYYVLISFGESLTTQGLPPMIALWMPNVAFAILGVFLYRRANRGEI
jgi:lipopolysaccharide export system permease protein